MTKVFQSKLFSQIPGIQHGFQTQNLSPPNPMLFCNQNHSSQVMFVDGLQPSTVKTTQADGMLTWKKQCLGIQTADCLPILLTDLEGKMIAAIHAGWRGLYQGILEKTVSTFKKYGFELKNVVAAIGPCIHACCYEVTDSMIQDFQKKWSHLWNAGHPPWYHVQPQNPHASSPQAKATEKNRWLDLPKVAILQLQASLVSKNQIEIVDFCTYCNSSSFASYRRSTHEGTCSTRQWSWIKKV